MMKASFAYLAAASILHDGNSVARILGDYEGLLREAGGRPSGPPEAAGLPLVHVVLTGGTEGLVLARAAERLASSPKEPVLLVAHPFHNSLPACLEILARLRRDGVSGRILYLEGPRDLEGAARLSEAARLAEVCAAMGRTRIGAVGAPSDWLVASSQGAEAVRASWGCELVDVPIEELAGRYRSLSGAAPDASAERFSSGSRFCREAGPSDLASAFRVYAALRSLVDELRLDAVTLRCFDLVTGESTTGCYALSRLADEGVDAGCEGDVPSILALRWMRLLSGKPAWMANPSRLDAGKRELLLAHCTVPAGIVEGYGLRSHFESGLGVGIQGEFRRGPVTLARIGGARLERLWLAEGEIVESGHEEGLCRTQARVRLDSASPEDLLSAPLGNHLVLVQGRLERLAADCRSLIAPVGA